MFLNANVQLVLDALSATGGRASLLGDGCWLWEGRVDRDGYGWYRNRPVHRFAYETCYGPIDAGLVVDHVCHNVDSNCPGGAACSHRRCVNPEHLESVTAAVNGSRARQRVKASRPYASKGTPKITVRIEPETWDRFGMVAGEQDRAKLIRAFITWYLGEGLLPNRPTL